MLIDSYKAGVDATILATGRTIHKLHTWMPRPFCWPGSSLQGAHVLAAAVGEAYIIGLPVQVSPPGVIEASLDAAPGVVAAPTRATTNAVAQAAAENSI